jgi:hypothetical protein
MAALRLHRPARGDRIQPNELTAVRNDRGELVALARDGRIWFPPAIECLEADHPRRRFAAMLSLVAVLMQTGDDREPYDRETACYYARYMLIPDTTFLLHSGSESDDRLAERFNVPLEEIAAKRDDLAPQGRGLSCETSGVGRC